MSLILEALKKSETNRRLGQVPDLGTPFAPTRRERSPLWALIVIVASLGAGLWWWFGRGPSVPAPAKPRVATQVATTSAPTAAPSRRAEPAQPAPARNPGPAIHDTAASGFRPRPPGLQRQVQQEDQRIFGPAQRLAPTSDNAIARKIVLAAKHKANAQASRVERVAPPASAPVTQAPALHASAPASVAAPMQPSRAQKTTDMRGYTLSPQPHAQAPPAPKLDMPTYYDLPFAMRKALPPLSLSMHVYTADPKQRFVILDGTRMVEGDTTSDSVTLREIRPNGVVLEFQGQRFFFPRDGL